MRCIVPNPAKKSAGINLPLSDDELAIVELYRALQLNRGEGLRRLATPSSSPMLPQDQELQSNYAAVAQDLLSPEPTAEHPAQR